MRFAGSRSTRTFSISATPLARSRRSAWMQYGQTAVEYIITAALIGVPPPLRPGWPKRPLRCPPRGRTRALARRRSRALLQRQARLAPSAHAAAQGVHVREAKLHQRCRCGLAAIAAIAIGDHVPAEVFGQLRTAGLELLQGHVYRVGT